MPALHTLSISRSHYNIARRFMVDNNLATPKDAVIKMIEIALAAHLATTAKGALGGSHGDAVPRKAQ